MRAWPRHGRAGWRTTAVLTAAITITACTASDVDTPGPTTVVATLGVLAPMTGPNAAAGRDAVRGAELAVALVNEAHGTGLPLAAEQGLPALGGQQLSLVSADTRSDPEVGKAAAVRLVSGQRVAGLIGAYDPEVTAAASLLTERLEIPFVNGDSSADHLTRRGLEWFFRVGPTDRMLGEALFSVLQSQQRPDTPPRGVAIVNTNRDTEVAAMIEALAAESGYPVAAALDINPGSDLAASLVRVRDADPDAVFLIASSPDAAAQLVNAVEALDYTPPGLMAIGSGFARLSFARATKTRNEGVFRGVAWSREVAARNPTAKAVLDRYQQTYGQPMTGVAAGNFMATLTLAAAINASGTLSPEPIRAALTTLDLTGRNTIMPWDGVQFGLDHQNDAARGTVEQIRQGQPRTVFPQELARLPIAWPLAEVRP